MTTKQMEGFCYLAQTLNFSEAAARLYISQPAFSRMIVHMEKELGCQLFIRSKTGSKLAIAGEQIYRHIKSILREYEDICNIAALAQKDELGHLQLGIMGNGLTETARKLIVAFKRQYPNVTLELKEYTEVELFRAMEMNWADIAFVIHIPELLRNKINRILIETSRDCVAIHRDNPLSGRTSIDFAELRDQPFIVLRETKSEMGYNHVMSLCLQNDFSPYIAAKVDSASTALSAVDCGLGCTIIPEAIREITGKNVVFVPLNNVSDNRYEAVWHKNYTNPWIDKFVEFLSVQLNG